MKFLLLVVLASLCAIVSVNAAEQASPDQALTALGITLPPVPSSIANYVPAVRSGKLIFLSGQIARGPDGKFVVGKVGVDVTEAQAVDAARGCAIQLLAALKAEIGDLAKVQRIVRVGGFVNCPPDYTAQAKIINGCSDLLVAVFGERGRHARAAVGVASLPAGAPVEIELIAEVAE